MKYLSRIVTLGLALVTLSIAACTADDEQESIELLQYVPADTPYVLALTEPFPDDLADRFEMVADKTMASYRTIINYYVSEAAAEAEHGEGGAGEAARLRAFVDELDTLLSVEGLRTAGISRDSLFAIYGDGLLPVMRLSLSDTAAFEAAIARLEAGWDEELAVGELGGVSYRYLDVEQLRVVIAAPGKDAVVALVPRAASDERLGQVLGLEKPRDSLAQDRKLREISKKYGFTDHLVGYVDVQQVAVSVLDDPQGRNRDLFAAVEFDASTVSTQCRDEFKELASIAPRVVAGYTSVSNRNLDASVIVELRDDIAKGAATLPAEVPGLGVDAGGWFSFGFSLDPLAARNFYEARLDAMEADPFECEHLAELQAGMNQGREALAKPVPPVVYSFRGFLANVSDLQGMDIATQKPPEAIDASVLLAMENVQDLVTMAAMMSPEVAALNLLPDGKAKPLDLPQLAEIAEEAFAALSENGLSISLGKDAGAQAEAMLQADVQTQGPLLSFSMDAKKYYEFIGEAGLQQGASDEHKAPMPPEVQNAVHDIMVSSADLYERMSINVHLTERGIEIDSRLTLSDQSGMK